MATEKKVPLSIIISTVDRATAGLRKVGEGVAKVGKKIRDVGGTMTSHFTLPVVAGFAFAVRELATFEKGMASVSTLIDTTTENLDAMGAAVLEISRRTPVSLEALTSALYDVRSAGVAASDQMVVLEQSARLGVAGLGSTKEAVGLVTSALNAFQLKGTDAAQVYDTIFTTIKSGKTTISELAQGFGAVAGTMAASNVKFDEYLASVAALTITGLPAAAAHTQLRAVIAGLTRTTDKTSKVFRKLGAKDFKDLIAKSGGLVPALDKIRALLKGNSSRMLELVGSTEALNAMIGLTGAQGEAFAGTLTNMRDGVNEVDGAFDKQNKTMLSGLQRTKNAMASIGITVGTILAPTIEKLSGWLQRAVDWFAKLSPVTKEWVVRIAAVVAVVGPALIVIGKLGQAFGFVTTAVRVLGAALLGNPIGLILTGLAIAAALVIANWDPISAFFSDLWMGIKQTFADAWEFIRPIVEKVVGAAKAINEAGLWIEDRLTGAAFDRAVQLRIDAEKGRAARPTLGLSPPPAVGAPAAAEARVKVDFANAPKGTRVTTDPSSTADVDLSVGWQMAF